MGRLEERGQQRMVRGPRPPPGLDGEGAEERGGDIAHRGDPGHGEAPLSAQRQCSVLGLVDRVSIEVHRLEDHGGELRRCGPPTLCGQPRGRRERVVTRRPEHAAVGEGQRLPQRGDAEVRRARSRPGGPWIVGVVLDDVDAVSRGGPEGRSQAEVVHDEDGVAAFCRRGDPAPGAGGGPGRAGARGPAGPATLSRAGSSTRAPRVDATHGPDPMSEGACAARPARRRRAGQTPRAPAPGCSGAPKPSQWYSEPFSQRSGITGCDPLVRVSSAARTHARCRPPRRQLSAPGPSKGRPPTPGRGKPTSSRSWVVDTSVRRRT